MNGFLDREGTLHPCNAWEHLYKALEVIKEMGVEISSGLDAEGYLQKLGWIVIRSSDVYGLIGIYVDGREGKKERLHLTDAQKEFLNKLYGGVNESCQKFIDELFEQDK